jgi:CRP/FNR family transcriptional regulator, cyclic AMP receptor protein
VDLAKDGQAEVLTFVPYTAQIGIGSSSQWRRSYLGEVRVLVSSLILESLFDVPLGGRTGRMPSPKKDTAQQELLSILQTASNRLEYLTPNDWALIVDRAKRTPFRKGDVLIQQGKQTKTVYVLVHGRAKVESSKAVIAHIGPGQVCGEMAFLENGAASATVTAEDDGEACAIEWNALSDLFELFPHLGSRFYRSLAVNLSRRLREQIMTKTIAPKSS